MKNKKILINYKTYFLAGGLLCLIIILNMLVIEPSLDRLNKDVDMTQKMLLDAKIEKNKISKLPELKKRFAVVRINQDKLNVLFVEDDIVDLVQELEKIADKTNNNIKIEIIEKNGKGRINQVKKTAGISLTNDFKQEDYFEMEISLTGNYENLLRFIYKINNIHYYNMITSLNIKTDEIDIKTEEVDINKSEKNNKTEDNVINLFSGNNFEVKGYDLLDDKRKVLQSKLKIIFYLNK